MKQIRKHQSFVQWFISLFIVLFLGIGSILFSTGIVFAASVATGVTGLSADSSGSATWSSSGGSITGSVKATKSSGCFGDSFSANDGTLTFTNSSGNVGQLSFDYSVTLSEGSAKVDGTAVTAGGSLNKTLNGGDTVEVYIKSNEANETPTTITISNLKLTAEQNVDITFLTPTNGSYTVDGVSITSTTVKTVKTTQDVVLSATPSSGFKFFGWKNQTLDSYFSTSASITTAFTEAATIYPEFVSSNSPIFEVSAKLFVDLNEATAYATSSGTQLITLINNGTLPSGDYTIPNGKTLLIPMDAAHTIVRDTPTVIYGSHANPSAYSLLTMASGASIIIQSGGAISCASQLCSSGQLGGWNGTPTGPGGRINMNLGSTIDVKSGGSLYVWGYIYGSGSVIARSGSTIYEAFQIKDWRGGTATSNCYSYTFIFSQYYIQNIEVPLTIYSGATEKLYTSANASSSAYPMQATFIGNGNNNTNPLFKIDSGYLVKDFDEGKDRLHVSVHGEVTISPMSISGIPVISSINTSGYEMPINSNITIDLESGSKANISQDIKLLPSAEINIKSGAELNINNGKALYLYDSSDWMNFTGSAKLYVIGYSVANGTTAKRTAAGLTDAKIDVNGTINVSGNLYTSAGGANITSSSGTGEIILLKAPGTGTSTIYEMADNKTKTSVVFDPAKLHNGANSNPNPYSGTNNEYTPTSGSSAGTTFDYHLPCETWYTGSHNCPLDGYTITWKNYDGAELEVDTNVTSGTTPTYNGPTPTKPEDAQYTYTFSGWAPEITEVTGDATYTATFSQTLRTYTVTWANYDGTTLETDNNVPYGTAPSYDSADPTRPASGGQEYEFVGWSTSMNQESGSPVAILDLVSENITYYAAFSSSAQNFDISFENYDGEELWSVTLGYGQTPTYNGPTPTKPADAQYTYTFNGWTPTIGPVTGDTTYTATYSETLRTYTVTWANYDGTVLETDNNVPYGTTPSYDGQTPSKEPTEYNTYSFSGWSPAISPVAGDVTYTATFAENTRYYTVTWINDGTVLETDTDVVYDAHPSYDGETPTKESEGKYRNYIFTGWAFSPDATEGIDPSLIGNLSIQEDTNFYAVFDPVGLFTDQNGETRLYDIDGRFQDEVTGLFHYDSSHYGDIADDQYYYLVNGIVQKGYGLVKLENPENNQHIFYLYYVLEDGTVLMDPNGCTFYVAITNEYTVNGEDVRSGLYYFDAEGHMWLGNLLLTGEYEFRVISSTTDRIGGGN